MAMGHHAPCWILVQQGWEDRAGSWGTSVSGCSEKIRPYVAPVGAEATESPRKFPGVSGMMDSRLLQAVARGGLRFQAGRNWDPQDCHKSPVCD